MSATNNLSKFSRSRSTRKVFQSGHFALRKRWQKIQLQTDLDRPTNASDENLIFRTNLEYRMERFQEQDQFNVKRAKEQKGMKPYTKLEKTLHEAKNIVDPSRIPAKKRFEWAPDMKYKWDIYESEMQRKYDTKMVNQGLQQENRVWKASQLMNNARDMTYRRAISLINDAVEKQFVPYEKSNKYTLALRALLNRYEEIMTNVVQQNATNWEFEYQQLSQEKMARLLDWDAEGIENLQQSKDADIFEENLEVEETEEQETEKTLEQLQQEIQQMDTQKSSEFRARTLKRDQRQSDKYKAALISEETNRANDTYVAPEVVTIQEKVLQKRQQLATEALARWHQSKIGKLFVLESDLIARIRPLQKKFYRNKYQTAYMKKLQDKLKLVRKQINIKDIRFMGSIYAGLNKIVDHAIVERSKMQDAPTEQDLKEEADLICDRVSEIVRLFFEYDARITDVRTALSAYEMMRDNETVNEEVKRRAGELLVYAHNEYKVVSEGHDAERDLW